MRTFDETLTSSTSDPLPPRIYIIGKLSENPTAFIKIADYEYAIPDPIEGFDTLFKTYIGMEIKYPRQSESSWVFIEKFIYHLQESHVNNSQLTTIINEMENFVKKQSQPPSN
jgi:hypothetical protein